MAKIPATQKKLRETYFFLGQLREKAKAFRLDTEEFEFFLSAFLSAARSVTFALQAEEKEKYDAWLPQWFQNRSEEDQELLEFMRVQRNVEQKRGGAEFSVTLEDVPVTEVRMDSRGHPAYYGFFWSGVPGTPPPRVGRYVRQFELSGSPVEVVQACDRYATLLRELVQYFTKAYTGELEAVN
jgi:hypothetical protein